MEENIRLRELAENFNMFVESLETDKVTAQLNELQEQHKQN